jgi:phytoene synthase
MDDAPGALMRLVRTRDHDRYLTALFAPRRDRTALLAIYAFNSEIARAREASREPILGQMRLQWWRETIAAVYEGRAVPRHEVAGPLAAAIAERGLSRGHFERLIDAREADLAADAPADMAALEAYAEASAAPLVSLALELSVTRGEAADAAARDLGIAYALAGLLRAVPFHARARRLYLPADRLAAKGVDAERTVFALKGVPGLSAVAAEVAERARRRLEGVRAVGAHLPRRAFPALLPATAAARALARLARAGHDPFAPKLQQRDGGLALRLALASLAGR